VVTTLIPSSAAADDGAEVRGAIDEELMKLPEKYRTAVVLCEIEGAPRALVAQQLGIPEGTLSSRLAYARKLLAGRFARRGITVAAALAVLIRDTRAIPIPGHLVRGTVSKVASSGAVPPAVSPLIEGVLTAMTTHRLMSLFGIALLTCAAAGLTLAVAQPDGAPAPSPKLEGKERRKNEHTVLVAAPAPPRDERKEQERAIEMILKRGGKLSYDYQRPDATRPNVFEPEAKPKDASAFHRVVAVTLRATKVTDDDLKLLALLPNLENLDLSETQTSSAGLAHLKGLKNLRVLCLWKTPVDDDGLEHLKDLTKMWLLILDETRITDAGLIHLKKMTELENWLGLAGTGVTDEGLVHLEGLVKLKSLNLRNTRVTEGGFKVLRTALAKTDISFGN
jgi:hypothetical protein